MPVVINGTTGLTGVAAIDSVSSTELGYVDGVTAPLQTQVDGKLATPGEWTTWAPAVTQNGVACNFTVNYAKYCKIGRFVSCVGFLRGGASTTGSTGAGLILSLPFASAVPFESCIGWYSYLDASPSNFYTGPMFVLSNVTTVTPWGALPNTVVPARYDYFQFGMTYEATA